MKSNDKVFNRRQFLVHGGQAALLAGLGIVGFKSGFFDGRAKSKGTALQNTRFAAMGTYLDISLEGKADPEAVRQAIAAVSNVERAMSFFDADSELSRLNRTRAGVACEISSALLAVLEAGRAAHKTTGGAFDPTVAPLVATWGFNHSAVTELPSTQKVRAACELVGLDKMTFDGSLVAFARDGMSVDLGGIAKGHGADRAAATLTEQGLSGIINAGGDIRVAGQRADGRQWHIGIRDPVHTDRVFATVDLGPDRAVATSGTYEQFLDIKGRRVSHIIDPRSGEPGSTVVSATVVAETAMMADALATACIVMSPSEGLSVLAHIRGVEGLLVWRTDGGSHRIEATKGMPVKVLYTV